MKFDKLDTLFAIFSIFAIIGLSIPFTTDEALSLRDHDQDRDGIIDDLDECPYVSENYNKFEDDDGCPDSVVEETVRYEFPDTDGDGIEDRKDDCINHPENFNGYLDSDGCPEIKPGSFGDVKDSDYDSISDSIDACPDEKETFNGFKDGDGCPDSLEDRILDSDKSSFYDGQCQDEKIPVMRINTNNIVCVSEETAQKWKKYGIGEIVSSSLESDDSKEKIKPIEEKLYDDLMNPRQIEYPNHLGFNDLHIEAINHLIPSGDDSVLEMIVHHHCKVYDDMTAVCLLFPTGMGDQDKPYGIEYVIGSDSYEELSEEEKTYWHYHKTELPNVRATLPDLTIDEANSLKPVLDETYGKVVYFWNIGDKYPIGNPFVVVIEELYKDKLE